MSGISESGARSRVYRPAKYLACPLLPLRPLHAHDTRCCHPVVPRVTHDHEGERAGMLKRPLAAVLLAAAMILGGCGSHDQGGGGQMHEVRMAVRSLATDPRMAARYTAFQALIQRATGLPVKLYQSSDYNGVIQAFASNQVDV